MESSIYDELVCPICKEKYNTEERLPRLLFNCGHTVCHTCVTQGITTDNDSSSRFRCPEDETDYTGVRLAETFPKNIALIKLLVKKAKISVNIGNNTGSNVKIRPSFEFSSPCNINNKAVTGVHNNPPVVMNTVISPFESNLAQVDKNDLTLNNNSNLFTNSNTNYNNGNGNVIINSLRSSIKKSSQLQLNIQPISDSITNINERLHNSTLPHKFCSKHPSRPLEIICIDHKVKICTNCALFGEHKTHKILNEEDFLKEIEVKAEILIELFDIIDTNLNNYKINNENNKISILENLLIKAEQKKCELTNQIESYFKEFIHEIKELEEKLKEDVSKNFEQINSKVIAIKEMPVDLQIKSEEWKAKVQEKLDILNEISESSNFNEEYVKLIEMNITDQDMITTADDIVIEFDKLKNFPIDSIEKIIENNKLDINYKIRNEVIASSIKYVRENNEEIQIFENFPQKENPIDTINSTSNTITQSNMNNSINFSNLNHSSNSFFNLSEESTIIKLNNSIDKVAEINYCHNKPPESTLQPNLINKPRKSETSSSLIKIPNSKDLSRSPAKSINIGFNIKKDCNRDKITFIKLQFNNESANFTGNDIGEESSKMIADNLCKTASKVKELKLTKTNLNDETLIPILKALENNSNINNINISKNLITDKSIDHIFNMLAKNRTLKTVYLSNNNFTSSGKEKLKSNNNKYTKIYL